jgi:hypothetical protein
MLFYKLNLSRSYTLELDRTGHFRYVRKDQEARWIDVIEMAMSRL